MIDQLGKFYIKNIVIWKFGLIGSSCWLFGANGQVVDPPIINIFISISASGWVVLTVLIRIWQTNKNNLQLDWLDQPVRSKNWWDCPGPRSRPSAGYWKLIRSRDWTDYFSLLTVQVSLGEDLAAGLADGVVLCHIANHVSPRSVSSIHVPSPAVVSSSGSDLQVVIFTCSAQVDWSKMPTKCWQFSVRLQEDWSQRGEWRALAWLYYWV